MEPHICYNLKATFLPCNHIAFTLLFGLDYTVIKPKLHHACMAIKTVSKKSDFTYRL